jgi:hypothetical protein
MQGEWGCWAGAVEQNRGPQLPSLRLIQRSERCICTDSHPAPTAERRRIPQLPSLRLIPRSERCICTDFPLRRLPNAAAFSVVRCTAIPPRRSRGRHRSSLRLLLPSPSAPACGPRFEKFRHTAAPDTPRLCSRLHRWATPRGKSDGGGWGVLGGGGRTKSWAPVALASAHPAERALYMYRFPPCADRRTPPHFPLYGVPRFPPAPIAGTPAQFSPSAAPLTVSTCLRAAV